MIPPGFAGRVNLTVPAITLLDLANRPGEMSGIGPIDPDLARDLAAAAARSPRSTWCVTVTDSQGHAIGHGCARPAPASRGHRGKRDTPGVSGGPDPHPAGPVQLHPRRAARAARRIRDLAVVHRDARAAGPAPGDRADPQR